MGYGEIEMELQRYNRVQRTNLSGRPVTGHHRKKCSDCDCSFYEGYYYTDFAAPWGAEKLCQECMATKLGGYFEPSFDEESDDY